MGEMTKYQAGREWSQDSHSIQLKKLKLNAKKDNIENFF